MAFKKLEWHKNGNYYVAIGLRIIYEILERSNNQYILYVDYGDESVHVDVIFSSLATAQQHAQKDHDEELVGWVQHAE